MKRIRGLVRSMGERLGLLRTNRGEFESILKLSPVGIAELDTATGRFVRVNERMCDLTGYSRKELLLKHVQALTHPEDRESDWKKYQQLVRGNRPEYDNEKRYVRKNGDVIWVHVTARLVPNFDGASLTSIGIIQDITQRKMAEHALLEARDAAERDRATLEAVLQSMTEGLAMAEPNGSIVFMNPAALSIYSCELRDVIGRAVQGLEALFEVRDTFGVLIPFSHWPISRALRGERFSDYEVHLKKLDGTKEWFASYSGNPVYDKDGRFVYAIVTMRDITTRKGVEAEVAAAKASAERANAAKDEFLAILSHELRTPLTPVLAAAQLLERRNDLPAPALMYLDIMKRNIGLEARLIDDLLDLTRITRGKITLNREMTHIPEVLEKVADVCRPDLDSKALTFSVDIADTELWVSADPSRLQQILWNVIKNAIKFTSHGGSICVRAFGDSGEAVVEVQDTGIGIEKQNLAKIFGAFEQADRKVTRQFGGLGLGLAITKQLVEMHGGSITAQSEGLGTGAMFTIRLPRVTRIGAREEESKGEPNRRSVHHGRILLVEDHQDTARMMGDVFRSSGYEVETVGDVVHALSAARAREFDVLVSDLGLPDRSGFELMDELRRHGSHLKGIALSGFGREEDVEMSRAAGFAEHLTKPVDMDALVAAVERVSAS